MFTFKLYTSPCVSGFNHVWTPLSFADGSSGRKGRESSSKSQTVHYHPEGGPRDHTCGGIADLGSCCTAHVVWPLDYFCAFFTGSGVAVQERQLSEGDKCGVCSQQQLVHHIPIRHRCSAGRTHAPTQAHVHRRTAAWCSYFPHRPTSTWERK